MSNMDDCGSRDLFEQYQARESARIAAASRTPDALVARPGNRKMAGILGFEFYLGPEIPAPEVDTTPADWKLDRAVRWRPLIVEAVREHDAWGLLVTEPDGDVKLLDVVQEIHTSAHVATMMAGRVYLLLAREAPERQPRKVAG